MKPDFHLLKKVLDLPTAPFHEHWVSRFVCEYCKKLGIPVRKDSYGNLKVTYKHGETQKTVAFTAHMDHPGFEVIQGGKAPRVRLLGGVPDKYFLGARVVLCDQGKFVKGKVIKLFNKKRREFLVRVAVPVKKESFGYFDLPGCKFKNGFIYSKAIDNVISVAVLLNFLKELAKKKAKARVICLFTRAEEVGCIGAVGVIKRKFLSRQIPTIVLEASSAKAAPVKIGGGPVLRVGDRLTTFSFELDWWLRVAAEKLKRKDPFFQYQRALLAGGRCEASLYILKGYPTGGLAFPLGNYHNAGPKSYAPEYIHRQDYKNMLQWLLALSQAEDSRSLLKKVQQGVKKDFERYVNRLKNISH